MLDHRKKPEEILITQQKETILITQQKEKILENKPGAGILKEGLH